MALLAVKVHKQAYHGPLQKSSCLALYVKHRLNALDLCNCGGFFVKSLHSAIVAPGYLDGQSEEGRLEPEEPGWPRCPDLLNTCYFAGGPRQSATNLPALSRIRGEQHVPLLCQLTLGCPGGAKELLTKDRITSHTHTPSRTACDSRPTPAAFGCYNTSQTRFPPRPTASKLSRSSPLPVRPSSGFRKQPYSRFQSQHNPQSRLKSPRTVPVNLGIHSPCTTQSQPVSDSPFCRPPPANATVTGPCGKGRGWWHAGAVRARLHELCQGQVQMHVWRSYGRVREVSLLSVHRVDHLVLALNWHVQNPRQDPHYSQTNSDRPPSVTLACLYFRCIFIHSPSAYESNAHPIPGASVCKRTASHQYQIASGLRRKCQGRGQHT